MLIDFNRFFGKVYSALFYSLVFVIVFASCQQKHVGLYDNLENPYKIVVLGNENEEVMYAIHLLQEAFFNMSGRRLPVTSTADGVAQPVFVGHASLPDELKEKYKIDELAKDEIFLVSSFNYLIITGGSTKSTLNAVIELLEEHFGCRWYTPDISFFPKNENLTLPLFEQKFIPPFEYRDTYYPSSFDTLWALHNRLTPAHTPMPDSLNFGTQFKPYTHSFYKLIPPRVYFSEHPEYYALIDGQRTWEKAQLCLTNEDIVSIASKQILSWTESDKHIRFIAIDQEDGGRWCQCKKCKAITDAEGSESANLINFVNKVATTVTASDPSVNFTTLAYMESERPPRTLRPLSNVMIRLCRMGYCDAHAVGSCHHAQSFVSKPQSIFREHLRGWNAISEKVYIWDYFEDFSSVLSPYPNFSSVKGNFKYYADNEVRGVFGQGTGREYDGNFSTYRAWLVSKLLWNPYQDVAKLENEFMKYYFGDAQKYMVQYLNLLESSMSSSDAYLVPYSGANYLKPYVLKQGEKLFESALKASRADSVVLTRIHKERFHLVFAQLKKLTEQERFENISHRNPSDVLDDFKVLSSRFNMDKINDHGVNVVNFGEKVAEIVEGK